MSDNPIITVTRKQLYDEIWEISVAGVSKKYEIPYSQLMSQIKEADIPVPSSGYWTKLTYGKPAPKPALPEPVNELISIYLSTPSKRNKKIEETRKPEQASQNKSSQSSSNAAIGQLSDKVIALGGNELAPTTEITDEVKEILTGLDTIEQFGQSYNIYNRETLYKEVWERPVTEVAQKYKVLDVAIHKVCKSLDVPTPPLGYWAKLKAGKPVVKIPLPHSTKPDQKTGLRTGTEFQVKTETDTLAFISEEERAVLLAVASQIIIPDENVKMHPLINQHRIKVVEWMNLRKQREAKAWNMRNMDSPPFLADSISEETLPRVCRIFDALIKAMEPLGCSLTNDLNFKVNGEIVPVSISESKDEVSHEITKDENMQLLKYQDDKRHNSWASKPNIRKYDRPYNGRISVSIYNSKSFRDCKTYVIEDRLGDIMVEIHEASYILRKEREAREEAERQRLEEERRKEERKIRYNAEVDRTDALTNMANDFDLACKIRNYISAVVDSGSSSEDKVAWIEWAKAKADWYDPTIAWTDEIFGKRKHQEDREHKKLEHIGYRW